LEGRWLLSGTPDADLIHRLMTHNATPQDLAEHRLTEVAIEGNLTYMREGQWIARFNLNASRPTAEAAVAQLGMGARLKKTLGEPHLGLIELPRAVNYAQVKARFSQLRLGAYIEPDVIIVPAAEPNDPLYLQQYAMPKISAPSAWNITTGSAGVVMAVFDTGVDYAHPDVAANMWTNADEIPENGVDDDGNDFVDDYYGYDFIDDDGDPMDISGHGTHVAGIMGAVGNNGVGVAGVNWNARIMAIRMPVRSTWRPRRSKALITSSS
jgi:subtilisin family serine protease